MNDLQRLREQWAASRHKDDLDAFIATGTKVMGFSKERGDAIRVAALLTGDYEDLTSTLIKPISNKGIVVLVSECVGGLAAVWIKWQQASGTTDDAPLRAMTLIAAMTTKPTERWPVTAQPSLDKMARESFESSEALYDAEVELDGGDRLLRSARWMADSIASACAGMGKLARNRREDAIQDFGHSLACAARASEDEQRARAKQLLRLRQFLMADPTDPPK